MRFILHEEKNIHINFSTDTLSAVLTQVIQSKENGIFSLFILEKDTEDKVSLPLEAFLRYMFIKGECRITLIITEKSLSHYKTGDPAEIESQRKYYFTYILEEEK